MTITDTPAIDETVQADVADLSQVIELMTTDKSNDWSDEIRVLESIEKQLEAARAQIETYEANVGPIQNIVVVSRYAELGRFAAVTLGANEEWRSNDITSALSTFWSQIDSRKIGGQSEEELTYWRTLADNLGIQHDGPEPIPVYSVPVDPMDDLQCESCQ
jgi:hypothetical protein